MGIKKGMQMRTKKRIVMEVTGEDGRKDDRRIIKMGMVASRGMVFTCKRGRHRISPLRQENEQTCCDALYCIILR